MFELYLLFSNFAFREVKWQRDSNIFCDAFIKRLRAGDCSQSFTRNYPGTFQIPWSGFQTSSLGKNCLAELQIRLIVFLLYFLQLYILSQVSRLHASPNPAYR